MRTDRVVACVVAGALLTATPVLAQGFSAAPRKPRPWSRISFFSNSATMTANEGPTTQFAELSAAFAYQLPDLDQDGADYGVDARVAEYASSSRPRRLSIYEGFVGGRFLKGALRVRAGHLWLTDLGTLGSLAGGLIEVRERAPIETGRWRVGLFGGAEPNVLDAGYASGVVKGGGYAAFDGADGRHHGVGLVVVRHRSLNERSSLTTNNSLNVKRRVYVYQSAEYDLRRPAGRAERGLTYFISNVRVIAHQRVDVQATYNRGRAIDARTLGDDVLNGRPITSTALEGLLFESRGGRVTVEVLPRVRVYAGYSQDRNNRDTEPTGRLLVGGYASNVAGSGFDISASDSTMHRPLGSFHSRYLSLGRQVGRRVYLSGDYSTLLSVIRFSRSDGITIETRPHTTRMSSTSSINISRILSLLVNVERTRDDYGRELRVLTGITWRVQ